MTMILSGETTGTENCSLNPLHVAVYLADQNPHRDRSLGITSMTRTLLDQIALRDDVSLTQIVSKSSYVQQQPAVGTYRIPLRTDNTVGRVIVDGCHPWLARPSVDLWYYPKGYVSRFASPSKPSVGTMHDAIVQHYADHHPDVRSSFAFRYWIAATKRSLKKLSCVFTVSDHAASQLRSFCDRHTISPPPIRVTYESSRWELQRGVQYEQSDCVTHLASSAPHKRTNWLLGSWRELQQRGRDLPRLDLIGDLDDAGQRIYGSMRGVSWRRPQSTSDLQASLGRARAHLLPSEIEGFGLPALEAYYVGTPACFVRGTSVSEVVQGEGHRGAFDLDDLDGFEKALDWALNAPPSMIEEISDAMYEKFSTSKTTDRIVDAFHDIVLK